MYDYNEREIIKDLVIFKILPFHMTPSLFKWKIEILREKLKTNDFADLRCIPLAEKAVRRYDQLEKEI